MKPTSTRKSTARGPLAAENACPACGKVMVEKHSKLSFPVNGEDVAVPHMAHLACPKCHEIVLRMDDARRLREGALDLYREKYNLLSADEIRGLRERLRLTQSALARLLRLGVNTISRWEAGRNIQTSAMDVLLRLVRDVPDSLAYLKKHAA